jgi:predicted nucleic-acid-binding Zn-ribbon protein
MAGEEEFQLCPKCKFGRLQAIGAAATRSDPQTNRVTTDLRGYKCDNCGYSESGEDKVSQANEQVDLSESANIKSAASGNNYDPTAS